MQLSEGQRDQKAYHPWSMKILVQGFLLLHIQFENTHQRERPLAHMTALRLLEPGELRVVFQLLTILTGGKLDSGSILFHLMAIPLFLGKEAMCKD